ncbi:GNAT family N-acetyltransferase [Naumannella halotolerans]|uniref:GNAT family N-acetyltransferase n=1 Tax=Naumannella halotolerans TaxID=993414 RepID=UPI00370D9360
MEGVSSRPMTPADWPAVEAIYRAGITTGHATFEAEPPPDWHAFASGKRPDLMLVAVHRDDRVVGWAAAGPVSARAVYRGVVEHSVYVSVVTRSGRTFQRWQHDSTAKDAAQVWFYVDDGTVYLEQIRAAHPDETK